MLVDYWATWCGPCRAEVPNVLENYLKYHDKGFDVIGISLDDKRSDAEEYVKQTNIPWPSLFHEIIGRFRLAESDGRQVRHHRHSDGDPRRSGGQRREHASPRTAARAEL